MGDPVRDLLIGASCAGSRLGMVRRSQQPPRLPPTRIPRTSGMRMWNWLARPQSESEKAGLPITVRHRSQLDTPPGFVTPRRKEKHISDDQSNESENHRGQPAVCTFHGEYSTLGRTDPPRCRSRAGVPNVRYCARMSLIWCIGEVSCSPGGEHDRDIGT